MLPCFFNFAKSEIPLSEGIVPGIARCAAAFSHPGFHFFQSIPKFAEFRSDIVDGGGVNAWQNGLNCFQLFTKFAGIAFLKFVLILNLEKRNDESDCKDRRC